MLSIDEILEKTGLTRYNFQAWRRNGQQLLPKPVSIDKRNILFDDSILERIRFKGTGADGDYWMQSIEVAVILNQINETSRQYLIRLKNGDIKIP